MACSVLVVSILHHECLAGEVGGVALYGIGLGELGRSGTGSRDRHSPDGCFLEDTGAGLLLEQQVPVLAVIGQGLGRLVKDHGQSGHLDSDGGSVLCLLKSRGRNFLSENEFLYIVRGLAHHLDTHGIVRHRSYQKVSLGCLDLYGAGLAGEYQQGSGNQE